VAGRGFNKIQRDKGGEKREKLQVTSYKGQVTRERQQ
jgi:hypothetical protein